MPNKFDAVDAHLGDTTSLVAASTEDLLATVDKAVAGLPNTTFQMMTIDPATAAPINSIVTRQHELSDEFIRDYAPTDPRFKRAVARGTKFWRNPDLMTKEEMRTTALYQDFLVKHGVSRQVGLTTGVADGLLYLTAFLRPEDKGEYERHYEPLVQHIHRATQNIMELRREGVDLSSLDASYDSRTMLLNARGEVMHVGQGAEQVLQHGFLDVVDRRIVTALPDDQRTVDRAIDQSLAHGLVVLEPIVCMIHSHHGLPGGSLTLHPLGQHSKMDLFGDQPHVVVVVRSETPNRLPTKMLANALGLRPAEAALVADLVTGLTLQEHAAQRGVTIETARTTLKLIFQKTPYNRQSALVQAVSRAFDIYL